MGNKVDVIAGQFKAQSKALLPSLTTPTVPPEVNPAPLNTYWYIHLAVLSVSASVYILSPSAPLQLASLTLAAMVVRKVSQMLRLQFTDKVTLVWENWAMTIFKPNHIEEITTWVKSTVTTSQALLNTN